LLGNEACGAEVITARFSRPQGFGFSAGQWIVLELTAEEKRLAETFTICSSPGDDYLEITTRLSGSEFKQSLARLSRGDRAVISGPGGRLSLPSGTLRLAFLVGGVGITPVRSMLRDACARGVVFEDALLFYGNRDVSCVPFEAELVAMVGCGVRIVLCYEHPPDGWTGESGFITAEMVRRHMELGGDDRLFVVTGPPPMVAAMERVLDELEIPAGSRAVERFGQREPASRLPDEGTLPG
jgi:ferredoxin-NADP reductase